MKNVLVKVEKSIRNVVCGKSESISVTEID